MAKRKKQLKRNKIIVGTVITVFLGAIAWTNESIDYLAKIGIENVNPSYTFLITAFLFLLSAAWVIWEVKN